jgi:excisionase family DNA binding protein
VRRHAPGYRHSGGIRDYYYWLWSTIQNEVRMATRALHYERPTGSVEFLRSADADDLQELLTVDDVAALLKVSRSWVYEHTRKRGTPRSGQLPHIKIGKYIRFEPRGVREFLVKLARIA